MWLIRFVSNTNLHIYAQICTNTIQIRISHILVFCAINRRIWRRLVPWTIFCCLYTIDWEWNWKCAICGNWWLTLIHLPTSFLIYANVSTITHTQKKNGLIIGRHHLNVHYSFFFVLSLSLFPILYCIHLLPHFLLLLLLFHKTIQYKCPLEVNYYIPVFNSSMWVCIINCVMIWSQTVRGEIESVGLNKSIGSFASIQFM